MTDRESAPPDTPSLEEMQQNWHELALRVSQLESAETALEKENKLLRQLLERAIEHRQKSHGELVLLLTSLVSKLPLKDVGVIVSKLMEHNTNLNQYLAALIKGTADAPLPQPAVLQTLEQTRRELTSALKPIIEELRQLNTPLEAGLLDALLARPEEFFSARMARANRCFIKGHVARERVLREFGPEALVLFNDMTTDSKLNPRPKPDEIALAFRSDFEQMLQNPNLPRDKREALQQLHQKVQRSKAGTEDFRRQRTAFQRLSFVIELIHYYEHQNTEPADIIFAQRLPALIEQVVLVNPGDALEEKLLAQAESLLAFIINPDNRLMVINNIGKSDLAGKTLKFVLRLRSDKTPEPEQGSAEFARHLLTLEPKPEAKTMVPILRLLSPAMQRLVVRAIIHSDRLRRSDAEALGKALAAELNLGSLAEDATAPPPVSPEMDRRMAWARIRDLIARRSDATSIASAIRERLHAKYDGEEVRESWITLTETDPLSLIRIFCQLPYLPSGKTDPIAKTVMEVYVTRLLHEKYASTYNKVVNSLKNMHRAKPDSPTLVNFLMLLRWVSPEAADKLSIDMGVPLPPG
jgi:hypothetical protein